jgi:transmembrane sensor
MHDMESALNPKHGSDIREQAAEWYLARKDGLAPARMQEFARWLATSPRHLAEYQAMERLGRDLPLVVHSAAAADELIERVRAADDADDTVVPFVAPGRGRARAPRRIRSRTWAVAAVLAFVAVDVVVLWPMVKERFAPQTREWTFESARGQLLEASLPDGSELKLDTDSEVRADYDETSRTMHQLRGKVRYKVGPGDSRQFVVRAGNMQILDVGTTFEVYLMPDATRITVLEGEVEVSVEGFTGKGRVGAGEQLDVVSGESPGKPKTVDAAKVTAWVDGEIRFDDVRLADATEEINRYLEKPFEIRSPELRDRPINYTFLVGKEESFRDYLLMTQHARVEEESARVVVTSR